MLTALKPTSKPLVYDLVAEAGVDTTDWVDYERPEVPASNPKYCYEWAFWDDAKRVIVVCLWFSQMREEAGRIFQNLNYRRLALSGVRANRARRMDMAFQLAAKRRLPVRVIVVDGVRRGEDGADVSSVEHRLLDTTPWAVVSYDAETGECRLVRGMEASRLTEEAAAPNTGGRRLARIAFNSSGWQRPTGEAGDHESEGTYNAQNKFGHEDWLFRGEWVLDGWRYAFIQGLNKHRLAYLGQSLDVTLYTVLPDKRRRLVATIYGLESLSDDQARDALNAFRARGWLKTMQEEVHDIGGQAQALGDPKWAEHVLNIRYRLDQVELHPPDLFLADDEWIRDRRRYMLYKFDDADRTRIEQTIGARSGTQSLPESRQLFRRGTKPVNYTPEHDKMQAKLMAELQAEYGREHVWREMDFVDVRVETDRELIYFEIKTDLDPRAVLRQAIGQILEYAYHPARTGRRPDRLVVVGRTTLGPEDEAYLSMLCERFKLPLGYRVVGI
jgi:hypothetical protein